MQTHAAHRFEFDNQPAAEAFLRTATNDYKATAPRTLVDRGYWLVVEVTYHAGYGWRLDHEASAHGGVRFDGSIA